MYNRHRLSVTIRLALLPALIIGACACGGSGPQTALKGADFYYQDGMRELEKKRYLKAQEKLQRVVSNFPGSPLVADAQFHLAEAYFGMKDFVSAVFEYQRVVDAYSHSRWVVRAQFQIGECYYRQMRRAELDQTETYQALSHFREFIEDNPDSPLAATARDRIETSRDRIAKKAYLTARLYHRQGFLEAAKISYEDLVRNYPDTVWNSDAQAQLGDIARQEGDLRKARYYWEELLDQTDDEKLKRKVTEWLGDLEEIGGE